MQPNRKRQERQSGSIKQNRVHTLGVGALLCLAAFTIAAAPAIADESCRDGWIDAAWTPIQLGVFAGPTQIFDRSVPVKGVRIAAPYATQQAVTGLDLGLLSRSESLTGLGIGLVQFSEGRVTGMQTGGLQYARDEMTGLQFGISNVVEGETHGAQLGFANLSESGEGLQAGFWNVAEDWKGLQIGVLNFNENGFLPVFPFFNFGF